MSGRRNGGRGHGHVNGSAGSGEEGDSRGGGDDSGHGGGHAKFWGWDMSHLSGGATSWRDQLLGGFRRLDVAYEPPHRRGVSDFHRS